MTEWTPAPNERTLDVRDVDPGIQHVFIRRLCDDLDDNQVLELIVDHDPWPLKLQMETAGNAGFSWNYLEHGPDVWRIRIATGEKV